MSIRLSSICACFRHGFRKWFATIFSYMVMLVSIGSLIIYIVRLIQGEGALF